MKKHGKTDSANTGSKKAPFFIMGCVRSGTTLLRDIIASHPLLYSPNETHFYRSSDPYGTMAYIAPLLNQKILQNHRRLDKIHQNQFRDDILFKSLNRGELMERYGQAYLQSQNAPSSARWFDKTPQHVYGGLLIAHQFPNSKFIHIVRNPLNVISSLRTSTVMTVKEIVGASNYWLEAAIIMKYLKTLLGNRLLEISYENLTSDPNRYTDKVVTFIDENPQEITFDFNIIKREKNNYRKTLSKNDIDIAREICGDMANHYGFIF